MSGISQQSQPSAGEIIFWDDFTCKEIDRSKWNIRITGEVYNHEQQAYVDSPKTIFVDEQAEGANGALVIQPHYSAGFLTPEEKKFDFISGRIDSRGKMEFQNGTVSARIKLTSGAGIWPAFWVLGANGDWPQCGEIDIMENVGEPGWTSVAVHGPGYSGETPLVNKKFFLHPNTATAWHTYCLNCTSSDGLVFTIDGELVYQATRPMIEYYGSWVFNSNKFLIFNLALGGIYPFKTNGIRSSYYGLPEETVRSIRNNEVKMLVDWVSISA